MAKPRDFRRFIRCSSVAMCVFSISNSGIASLYDPGSCGDTDYYNYCNNQCPTCGAPYYSEGWWGSSCYEKSSTTCATAEPVTSGGTTHISSVIYATSGSVTGKKYCEDNECHSESSTLVVAEGVCDITGVSCETGYSQKTLSSTESFLADKQTPYRSSYIQDPIARAVDCNGANPYTDIGSHNGLAPGEFETTFSNDMIIRGRAKCSSTNGTSGVPGTPSDTQGKYCWCKITRVKDIKTSSSTYNQWLPVWSDWVLAGYGFDPNYTAATLFNKNQIPWNTPGTYPDTNSCWLGCAELCADQSIGGAEPGSSILSTMKNNNAIHQYQCTANTINIVWSGVGDEAKFGDTNAVVNASHEATSQVTYGGDIVTPTQAYSPTGKTFLGWKFQNTQS